MTHAYIDPQRRQVVTRDLKRTDRSLNCGVSDGYGNLVDIEVDHHGRWSVVIKWNGQSSVVVASGLFPSAEED